MTPYDEIEEWRSRRLAELGGTQEEPQAGGGFQEFLGRVLEGVGQTGVPGRIAAGLPGLARGIAEAVPEAFRGFARVGRGRFGEPPEPEYILGPGTQRVFPYEAGQRFAPEPFESQAATFPSQVGRGLAALLTGGASEPPLTPEELANWPTALMLAHPVSGGVARTAYQGAAQAWAGQTARRVASKVLLKAGKPEAALRVRFTSRPIPAGAAPERVIEPGSRVIGISPAGHKVDGVVLSVSEDGFTAHVIQQGERGSTVRSIAVKRLKTSSEPVPAGLELPPQIQARAAEIARGQAEMPIEPIQGVKSLPDMVKAQIARRDAMAKAAAAKPITKPLPEAARPAVAAGAPISRVAREWDVRVFQKMTGDTRSVRVMALDEIEAGREAKRTLDLGSDWVVEKVTIPTVAKAVPATAKPAVQPPVGKPTEAVITLGRYEVTKNIIPGSGFPARLNILGNLEPSKPRIGYYTARIPGSAKEIQIDVSQLTPATKALQVTISPPIEQGKLLPPDFAYDKLADVLTTSEMRQFLGILKEDFPTATHAAGKRVTEGHRAVVQSLKLPTTAQPAVQPPVGKPTEAGIAQPGPVAVSRQPAPSTLGEGPPPAQAAAAPRAPGGVPPVKPPVPPAGDMPPVEPILPRPRTLADMNREAKGMRAMMPEQRAAVMDMAKPIEGKIIYQARPFNEHAKNLLGPDTGFVKALRAVPGVKQIAGVWNPAQMSRNNPVAMIGLRQGIFQEIEKARIRFATLRWWQDADTAFGFKPTATLYGLKPTSAVWKASKATPAPGGQERGKMFGTINDLIEHPERYALTEEQRRVLALAEDALTQSVRDAQRAGVDVVELAESYWPRIVTKGPKGTQGFAGIKRRVSSAKGYTRQRVFSDIDDVVASGYDVETDPRRVFAARLEAGVDTIAHQNSRKQIAALPGVQKPLERMAQKFPETLQGAQQARTARDAAKSTVIRAGAKATPEEMLAMRQAEADYITAMREVYAKKIEAGTPGYYELRLPNGRIAPQELVQEVEKLVLLPELRQTGAGPAARLVQEVSQLLRTTLTNVDLAAGYIQGQALFFRNNPVWWKAQVQSIVGLIDDPAAWVAKNFDVIDEGVRAAAIVAPTEFLFAKQGLASIPLRIPYIGPALGSFNRAFEWLITAGQTELYKAARSGAFKKAGMDELVSLGSAIRKEVGTESYAILGVRPTQRTMEALSLFAARFFRATVGILGQSFTRGAGGAEARKAVGSLIAGGTALLIGIKWAQDRKLPNMTDPYAPDWMQFRLGKTYFSTFGPFYPYFRTMARMGVALGEGDPVKAGTELRRFLTSKESLPLRAADIAGQLIYYGTAYVYGTKIEKTWASIAKGILSEFATPISIQEIPSAIAEGRPEGVLEFGGLVGRPVRVASEWAKDLEAYHALPSNVDEAEAKGLATRADYRTDHPDVDAKLFITGQVSSLQTDKASDIVVALMKEHNIKVDDIKSLKEKEFESPIQKERRDWLRKELGEEITVPKVPALAPSKSRAPTQQSTKDVAETWKKRRLAEIRAEATPVGAR